MVVVNVDDTESDGTAGDAATDRSDDEESTQNDERESTQSDDEESTQSDDEESTQSDGRRERTVPAEAVPAMFRAMFEHTNDAVFFVDLENDSILDCSPAAEDLTGYSRERLLSMPASDLHPHNFGEFLEFAERVRDCGSARTDSITCYRRGGRIVPAQMSATVVEVDGRPHLLNHVREEIDSDQREWHETLTEHSRELVSVLDPDGTVRYQNPTVEHVLGYDPEQLRGDAYLDRVHPDDRDTVAALLDGAAGDAAHDPERVEYRYQSADGSWLWLESGAAYHPDTPVDGFVVNSREITARTENRQQAAVLNRVLRHNLRNELTAILGFADRLVAATERDETTSDGTATDGDETTSDGTATDGDETAADGRATDAELDLAATARRLYESARDLRDVASYASLLSDIFESHHVRQQRHDVVTLLDGVAADVRAEYPEAVVELAVPAAAFVTAAPRLDIAVRQLVENAVEHSDAETPRAVVSVEQSGGTTLTVADNGPGIPEQERATLLEGEERPLQHGSGVGLWLVNWIVTRSGGRITFCENDPRGSRVRLSFPPTEESAE